MSHNPVITLPNLTKENLQELCRTCLTSLQTNESTDKIARNGGSMMSYNVFVMPNLQKLMVFFTNLDAMPVSTNINNKFQEDDSFPRKVCQVCYYKLLDIDEFRLVALQSTQLLYQAIQHSSHGREQQPTYKLELDDLSAEEKLQHCKELVEKNNALQLESTITIKDEYIDLDEPRIQSPVRFNAETVVSIPSQVVRMLQDDQSPPENIDLKYNVDRMLYANDELSRISFDRESSVGNDADDEECALRNGAANNSTSTSSRFNSVNNHHNKNGNNHNKMGKNSKKSVSSTGKRQRDRTKTCLKCPSCDKQVYKQVYLDAHIRAVHEGHDKPFLCQECQKAFTRYHQLHVHIKSNHLFEQKFVCEFDGCNATFHVSDKLDRHRRVQHASESDSISIGLQAILSVQGSLHDLKHFCQKCSKQFSSKRALSEHLKRHAQIKDHVCSICGAAKVTRIELQTHMRVHEPEAEKFSCPVCPKEFNHKNAISRHVRVVHEGQRRFVCRYCAKRFGTRNSQISHERLHTGEKPYNCKVCEKTFAQSESLKSHMKNHDKSLRTHVCSFCSLRFITRKNLVDHEERHRGSKPHICLICHRGFAHNEDLLAHQNTHEEKECDMMSEYIEETPTN